jgi:hypothetical protein
MGSVHDSPTEELRPEISVETEANHRISQTLPQRTLPPQILLQRPSFMGGMMTVICNSDGHETPAPTTYSPTTGSESVVGESVMGESVVGEYVVGELLACGG